MMKSTLKHIIITIIPISFIFVSCNSDYNSAPEPEFDSLKVFNDTATIIKTDTLSGLDVFCSRWIKVTETDSGKVIFNPCDASNHIIEIKEEKKDYFLFYQWGHEVTKHKICSFIKKDKWNCQIGAYFGKNHYYYEIKIIDTDIQLSKWNWSWIAAFDKKEDSYSSLFIPEHSVNEYKVINQPCLECWDSEICIDYIRQYIGKPFSQLLNDSNFQYRLALLYNGVHQDFLDKFDADEILKTTNDRYIILNANIKDGGEPVEKILVIDLENSIIGSAYTKNGRYMYAISEVDEDLYPKPLSEWISKRK